ncbi:hypothetical protein EXE43_10190 [Halorubrum sp. SS5]|nr:hypothetical protein EXE43_10190 [Halorubrum sp. SS5]
MRIFAFSDWRIQSIEGLTDVLEQEKPIDLIVYAGDDVRRFQKNSRNVFSELAEQTRLGSVLAVLGNDDISGTGVLDARGVHNLHQKPAVDEDYVFFGQEGAVEGGPGLLLYTEDEIETHLNQQYQEFGTKIPILVTHVPPNGILDIAQRFGQRHIGSTAVRGFVEKIAPIVTICGHCHQFGGRAEEHHFGTVINIASNDSTGSDGRYAIIELDGEDLEYVLKTVEDGPADPLQQLSQVGQRRLRQFQEAGISEIEDINEENREDLLELPGVYEWHVDMWSKEVEAINHGEVMVSDPDEFQYLTQDDLVLLDIETDLSQERVWLVGLYSYQTGEYTHIFGKDDEQELLKSLIEYLDDQNKPKIVYYANSYFDKKCLEDRFREHNLSRGATLLESSEDLGITVQNYLIGDFNRTGLERVASEVSGYEYEHTELDGFVVGSRYTRYLLDEVEPDWDELISYNEDDVRALKSVVDSIRELLPEEE